jgi:hypothetical protein
LLAVADVEVHDGLCHCFQQQTAQHKCIAQGLALTEVWGGRTHSGFRIKAHRTLRQRQA